MGNATLWSHDGAHRHYSYGTPLYPLLKLGAVEPFFFNLQHVLATSSSQPSGSCNILSPEDIFGIVKLENLIFKKAVLKGCVCASSSLLHGPGPSLSL